MTTHHATCLLVGEQTYGPRGYARRSFSQITLAWRGRPLTSHEVIISTISAVRTSNGMTVTAVLDQNPCPKGVKVSDQQMKDLQDRALTRRAFHGEWSYALLPGPRVLPHPGQRPHDSGPGRGRGTASRCPQLRCREW